MKTPPLHLIQSFLAFTQASNMSKAADSLQMSQPSLTGHLKAFEDYFSQDVFAFQGRKKILTPFGLQLQQTLEARFINIGKDLKDLTDRFEKPEKILVKIAGRGEILNYIAPKINFPGSLFFIDTDGAAASSGVVDRNFDIAISNHTAKTQALHAKKLFIDHSALVLPKKWGLEQKPFHSLLPLLLGKPLIAYKESESSLETFLKSYKIKEMPLPHRVISNWPSLMTMVELGQGWTLAPDRYKAGSHTISIPIPGNIIRPTQFFALYRKESISLSWFKNLIQEIHAACE